MRNPISTAVCGVLIVAAALLAVHLGNGHQAQAAARGGPVLVAKVDGCTLWHVESFGHYVWFSTGSSGCGGVAVH